MSRLSGFLLLLINAAIFIFALSLLGACERVNEILTPIQKPVEPVLIINLTGKWHYRMVTKGIACNGMVSEGIANLKAKADLIDTVTLSGGWHRVVSGNCVSGEYQQQSYKLDVPLAKTITPKGLSLLLKASIGNDGSVLKVAAPNNKKIIIDYSVNASSYTIEWLKQ